MNITEVRVKLVNENGENERLLGFCSVTFDNAFVVRDLKIIGGPKGFFVAMPSRKLMDRCTGCGFKNQMRARFCNACGGRLDENRGLRIADGRPKLHADIAHPIHAGCREMIQQTVIESFQMECEKAKQPGYVSNYDDIDQDMEPAHSAPVGTDLDRSSRGHQAPGPRSGAGTFRSQGGREVSYRYPAE